MSKDQKIKTYHITTFGCQMNASDSERVSAVAENLGFRMTEDISNADLIIINSCSIRQKAEDRVMGMGKRIKEYKKNNPNLVTILTGCMAKREDRSLSSGEKNLNLNFENDEKYEKSLYKLMPWLDHIVQIKDIHKLGNQLGIDENINVSEYLSIKPKVNKSFIQYIPISTGCNKFCTYCIVPFSRGREIYRPYKEILKELKETINNGAKEITILGQNVNSWRGYRDEEKQNYIESVDPHRLQKNQMPDGMIDFSDLMDDIGEYVDEYIKSSGNLIWIKFTSAHPYDIDEKLVNVILKHTSIAKQFHFALQSGSNSVLKRMNRHYKIEDFSNKCELIREKIPGVGISTDVIVGFCSETDDEFNSTVDIMKKLKFDQAFIAEYSTRKGTVAARIYKDDVPNEVKAKRKVILNDILAQGNLDRNLKMVGKTVDILVYKKNKLGFVGRTENNKDVIIRSINNINIGKFYRAIITDVNNWSLEGNLIA